MNVVSEEVKILVQKEYEAAKADHGPLASMHEGYAVLLEEMEETGEAFNKAKGTLECLWDEVKRDNLDDSKLMAAVIVAGAIETACEAIQVAAVAKRILDLTEKEADHEEDLRDM